LEGSGDPNQLTVVVADDGQGGVDLSHGTGLRGLADRVSVADGDLRVDSRVGQGTRVTCRLPVPLQAIPVQPRVRSTGQSTGTEPDVTTVVGAGR
jgi:glucose-6-phosphate-specific signal transduction histidine kinase